MFIERAYCLGIHPHTSGQLHSVKIITAQKWENEKGTLSGDCIPSLSIRRKVRATGERTSKGSQDPFGPIPVDLSTQLS